MIISTKNLVNSLIKKKLRLSFAESCTGGLLSSTITTIPGSSKIFDMGFVTYSNKSKIKILSVPKNIINNFGAVSRETCISMVRNLCKISKSNINISITGIAGPNGGTKLKPVGLVFIGIKRGRKMIIKKYLFKSKSRLEIQRKTVKEAIKLIIKVI